MSTYYLINSSNFNFARIADGNGERSVPSPNVSNFTAPDHGTEPLADPMGRLIVRLADGTGYLPGSDTLLQSDYIGNITVELIDPNPTRLIAYSGNNTSAADVWIQTFDIAILPVLGNVPSNTYLIPAGQLYSFSYNPARRYFTGLAIGFSTTQTTFTPVAAPAGTLFVERYT